MITKAVFEKEFKNDIKRVRRRSRVYLRLHSAENVHDLRTALKRIESRAEILPKHSKRDLSKYLELCKRLFKATTKIRDFDIILDRLSGYAELDGNEITDRITKKRNNCVSRSLKIARRITIYEREFDAKDLKERKLQRRQGRISKRLNNKIELLLPIVIEDPKRYEELHLLRKTCKELRYILEASGEEGKTESLRKWQRYLGEIHDSDVVIAYLSKQKKTRAITNVIRDLSLARAKQFRDFVNLFEKKPQALFPPSSPVPAENQNLVRSG